MKSSWSLLPLPICLAVASLDFSAQALAQAQEQFRVAKLSNSSAAYNQVAVGDFNKDGKLDVAVVSNSNNSISVLLGNGDGTFQLPAEYGVGGTPYAVIVADFNRDGNLDIAVTAFGPSAPTCSSPCSLVSVFLGNGDGTFQSRMDFPTGLLPESMAVGDFNGDGKLDLVITCGQDPCNGFNVLFGNGDGTFQLPVTYTTSGAPQSVAAGDFNGDGKADLALISWVNGVGNFLNIFINKGDGTFQTPVTFTTSSSPLSVVVADVNSDGKPDLVVVCTSGVSVLLGNGNGTFQAHLDYTTGGLPSNIVVADFNGDGKPDVALGIGYEMLAIGFGNGDGTFQAPIYYAAGSELNGPNGLVVGDFNGDQKPDLAVSDGLPQPLQGTVSVLLNDGKGGFQAARSFGLGNVPQSVDLADLNGDGKLDLVAGTSSGVAVILGNGNGTFGTETDYTGGGTGVGDFNGDGKLDLTNGATVLLGKGDGTFGTPLNTGAAAAGVVAVGDFNGDGKLDIAVAAQPAGVAILLGNGDGTFQRPVTYATAAGVRSIAVGDFNGDGKPDLVALVASAGSDVEVLLNRGDGTFLSAVAYSSGGVSTAVAVGDFNMDGHPDLAVANGATSCHTAIDHRVCTTKNSMGILLGNGDGTFQPAVTYTTGLGPLSIVVADFNGDGKPDVALANSAGTTISMFWGKGDGTLRPRLDYHVGAAPIALAAGDLNGDSKPDVVVANAAATLNASPGMNAATVLLNTAGGPASALLVSTSFTGGDTGTARVSSQPTQIVCGEECSAAYVPGTSVTLMTQSAPDYGYELTGWSGDCTGTGACVLDMNTDHAVVASFAPSTTILNLNLAFAGNGSGAVTGQYCSGPCSIPLPIGANVVLGALPDSGSTFGGWSGASCTATMIACNVTMNSNVTVTATFNTAQAPLDFSITPASTSLTVPAGGSMISDAVTISPLNGSFSNVVQLSCTVTGSTPLATCSLSSTSVTPGANSVKSTLTVTAPTQSAKVISPEDIRGTSPLYEIFLSIPFALIALGLAADKAKNRTRGARALCSLIIAFAALQAGCGGGSNPPPPLNYAVTVTATSGAIQHTTQISVNVP